MVYCNLHYKKFIRMTSPFTCLCRTGRMTVDGEKAVGGRPES